MAFWSKRTTGRAPTTADEEGETVNQHAAVLQEVAGRGWGGTETITSLANALGNEAAVIVKQHPNVQHSSMQHLCKVLDGMLELVNKSVREFAYIKATGSSPSAQTETPSVNPLRALNPEAFDKGAVITGWARELRRAATSGHLTDAEVITALQTALGSEIAAMVLRRKRVDVCIVRLPTSTSERTVMRVCERGPTNHGRR